MNVRSNLLAILAAGLVWSASASAVTKGNVSYHCVNSRSQELKAAVKSSECKAPYHWAKAPAVVAKVKAKAKAKEKTTTLAHAKKHKGRVATSKKALNH